MCSQPHQQGWSHFYHETTFVDKALQLRENIHWTRTKDRVHCVHVTKKCALVTVVRFVLQIHRGFERFLKSMTTILLLLYIHCHMLNPYQQGFLGHSSSSIKADFWNEAEGTLWNDKRCLIVSRRKRITNKKMKFKSLYCQIQKRD